MTFKFSHMGLAAMVMLAWACHEPTGTTLAQQPGCATELADSTFSTDFCNLAEGFDPSDVISGGPPKDGIPAIDQPQFVSIAEADSWLEDSEPVIVVEQGNETRAYPIQILMWHELVNDTLDGRPLVISYCPLCNTAIVFERRVNGEATTFGTTGRLRYSNLIMYDRASETWWQQATGQAIMGQYAGERLPFVAAEMIAWSDFRDEGMGQVLSRNTGFNRAYGTNPYVGYDDTSTRPFLYQGPPAPDQLAYLARVLGLEHGGEALAFPWADVQAAHVLSAEVGDETIVAIWQAGVSSALDTQSIEDGRDVGSVAAFLAEDHDLAWDGDHIVDVATGSLWNGRGEAVSGPLAGETLTLLPGVPHFWFSWVAFQPSTRVIRAD